MSGKRPARTMVHRTRTRYVLKTTTGCKKNHYYTNCVPNGLPLTKFLLDATIFTDKKEIPKEIKSYNPKHVRVYVTSIDKIRVH